MGGDVHALHAWPAGRPAAVAHDRPHRCCLPARPPRRSGTPATAARRACGWRCPRHHAPYGRVTGRQTHLPPRHRGAAWAPAATPALAARAGLRPPPHSRRPWHPRQPPSRGGRPPARPQTGSTMASVAPPRRAGRGRGRRRPPPSAGVAAPPRSSAASGVGGGVATCCGLLRLPPTRVVPVSRCGASPSLFFFFFFFSSLVVCVVSV